MGADNFTAYAAGKTPGEAFHAAVEQARYDHGHAGYSGTIAEKGNFVHVEVPKGITLKSFLALLEDAGDIGENSVEYLLSQVRDHKLHGKGARKTLYGKTLKQTEAALAKEQRRVAGFWAKVEKRGGYALVMALRKAAELHHGDKWGPALCVGPLTGAAAKGVLGWTAGATYSNGGYRIKRGTRVYRFSGYASS